jgi:CTP synthase
MQEKEKKGEQEKLLHSLSDKSDEHEFYTPVPEGYKVGRTKYIIVTGSVISGVGKGTFTSCLGNILQLKHGFNVSPVKFDGYLNVDAGTLNPYRHGEVFVLDDGTECDLDLGTYERMLNKNISKDNYLTSGKIFKTIVDRERAGKYLGRDVQFIPHVTGEIKGFLRKLSMKTKADVVLVEVGGTIGDIENSYFLEAMRELAYEEGKQNVCFINVVYILRPKALGEFKSKAAQLGIRNLMSMGIQPNIIICRSEDEIPVQVREKISIYSNVPLKRVINMHDAANIHNIPLYLHDSNLDGAVLNILSMDNNGNADSKLFKKWIEVNDKFLKIKEELSIGIIGKYTKNC